jgi:hypothetical protein
MPRNCNVVMNNLIDHNVMLVGDPQVLIAGNASRARAIDLGIASLEQARQAELESCMTP